MYMYMYENVWCGRTLHVCETPYLYTFTVIIRQIWRHKIMVELLYRGLTEIELDPIANYNAFIFYSLAFLLFTLKVICHHCCVCDVKCAIYCSISPSQPHTAATAVSVSFACSWRRAQILTSVDSSVVKSAMPEPLSRVRVCPMYMYIHCTDAICAFAFRFLTWLLTQKCWVLFCFEKHQYLGWCKTASNLSTCSRLTFNTVSHTCTSYAHM